ncbi:MAG: HPr family phosphocarrier protein [Thermoanaerobaculia bacterium]
MVQRELAVTNRLGLHARAAAKLVHTAGAFSSQISLAMDGEEVDAKSILGILLLAAAQGSAVTVRCEGADEGKAMETIAELFADRFGEDS